MGTKIKLAVAIASAAVMSSSVFAEEKDHRHHKAHVHAEVTVNLLQSDESVLLEIEAPANDVVGFEHQPKNDAQKDAIKRALALLNKPDSLFAFNKDAECEVKDIDIAHTFDVEHDDHDEHHDDHKKGHDHHDEHHDDHKKGHDHHDEHHDDHKKGHDDHDEHHDDHKKGHDHHDEHKGHHDDHHDEHKAEHREFIVNYSFECHHPEKLSSFSTNWFSEFSATEEINLKGVMDKGAVSKELTAKNNKVSL
ncbi:zinc-binding protein [Veronia nyctiphanis]|uniref:Zinc-binding protein n=1 Tax=Veronia nyctiphanis TaxID=1278244 RepID=A0A4Q0YSM8_9GAMM|nr:DUF2796 domain-containing protein [Veronia nyctiphanis]RXJ72109.1 zinc-binding protein [Veronia nyctiphanis]